MKRLPSLPAHIDFLEIIRYYAVGGVVNVIGYALFVLLIHLGVEHKLAASTLYLLGALISFWLNRKLVFNSGAILRSSLIRLCLMLLAGYTLNILILFVCVDKLRFSAGVVQLFSIFFVSVFFYLFNKFFVHKSYSK